MRHFLLAVLLLAQHRPTPRDRMYAVQTLTHPVVATLLNHLESDYDAGAPPTFRAEGRRRETFVVRWGGCGWRSAHWMVELPGVRDALRHDGFVALKCVNPNYGPESQDVEPVVLPRF